MEQRKLTMKKYRDKVCDEIEIEKRGNEFFYIKENIKEEQCRICKSRGNIKMCRLLIVENKCKNFKERNN